MKSLKRLTTIVVAALLVVACGREDSAGFVQSAKSYLAKNDLPAASIQLKNALAKDPSNATARFLLGKTLLEMGDGPGAETELRKALDLKYPSDEAVPLLLSALLVQGEFKRVLAVSEERPVEADPARAEAETVRALAYFALGQQENAKQALGIASALAPNNPSVLSAQARAAVIAGDLAGAQRFIEAALKAEPSNPGVLLFKAEIESAQSKYAEAVVTLKQIIDARPNSLAARYALISLLVQLRKIDDAAVQLAEVAKLAPDDPRTAYSQALVAFARNDIPGARESIQKAVQRSPDYLQARYLSALIDARAGALAGAEDSLRAVMAKAPDNDSVRRALSEVYLRRGQAAQAVETLEPALKRDANNPALLRIMAEAYFAMNNPGKSIELLERANAVEQNNTGGRIRLAQVRLAAGSSSQAFKELEVLSESELADQNADFALISAHTQRREFDKALAAADQLVKKQPSNPAGYNARGVVYMAMGDRKNARTSFEKAVAVDSKYMTAVYNLARLDMLDRKYDAVRQTYQKILETDPKAEPALLGLVDVLAATGAPQSDIRAAIERAVTANPGSARARVALMTYFLRTKDYKAATAASQAAKAAFPDDVQVLEMASVVEQTTGASNQARDTLRRVVQLQPQNPMPLLRLGTLQLKADDATGALESFRAALSMKPDNILAVGGMTDAYAKSGQFGAGLEEARRLKADAATFASGSLLEAELYGRQKKWTEMASAYRSLIAKSPFPYAIVRFDYALRASGKASDAAASTDKWLKSHPEDPTVRTYLGEMKMTNKDFRGAANEFTLALKSQPDNPLLLNNLAWSLNEIGDPKALEFGARAYSIAPNSVTIADTYGWSLITQGQAPDGVRVLRAAAVAAPENVELRLHLARGLIKAGDTAEAKKELERIVSGSSPVRAEAEQLLKTL